MSRTFNLQLVVIALLGSALTAETFAHGGIAPAYLLNYPMGLLAPPQPNRLPLCDQPGANGDCGLLQSCLIDEAKQPLLGAENRYSVGQNFEVPWLISVVHGNGNTITVRLRHNTTGRTDVLRQNFPQGAGRQEGEVIIVDSLQVPSDFPAGMAVLEVANDYVGAAYYDCLDLEVLDDSVIFFDSFE